MPAYHFTLHSYRSWNADNPRGYVRYGQGIQPPSKSVARFYDSRAKQSPVLFDRRHQSTITWIVWDACRHRDWRLHCVAFEPSHVHILVSWRSNDEWRIIRRKLKNLVSWALAKESAIEGRRWLVRKGSRKRVRDRGHFNYLVSNYLPKHGGLFWKEGDVPPAAPDWSANVGRSRQSPASAGG
jgi:REP element-mobilizing transposase RayT